MAVITLTLLYGSPEIAGLLCPRKSAYEDRFADNAHVVPVLRGRRGSSIQFKLLGSIRAAELRPFGLLLFHSIRPSQLDRASYRAFATVSGQWQPSANRRPVAGRENTKSIEVLPVYSTGRSASRRYQRPFLRDFLGS